MEISLLHEPVPIFLAIMFAILIAPILSESLRLPGVVGLILAGMLVGPFGFHLLSEEGIVSDLATIGLIYLMFGAGLEVNLQQLNRVRNKAIFFGILTFMIPLVMGIGLGLALELNLLGAVLLGSALSSHTLLALPIVTRLGIIANQAISVTIGATVFTDVSAFLVLAVISGMQSGDASPGNFVWLVFVTAVYAGLLLWTLPRIGKWFFRHFPSTLVEFQFILVALFVAAFLAEVIGMHGVVGAFLAGLAINSTLPHHSPVVGRILFIGESLFIPIFLIYSGMITDAGSFIRDSNTLMVGIGMTVIAYIAKFLAAWITGRVYGYSWAEVMTVFGLSQAQAAVTLPTIIVGVELGLFPETTFGGTMMMILFTSFTSPWLVKRYGKLLQKAPQAEEQPTSVFERILVSVYNPHTQEILLSLAGILAQAGKGKLTALRVLPPTNGKTSAKPDDSLQKTIDETVHDDLTCQIIQRIDKSPADGIRHAALENDATLILVGWRGKATFKQSVFGTILDEVIWKAPVPVMVARLEMPIAAEQRVTLVITPGSISAGQVQETFKIGCAIAHALNVPLNILAHEPYCPTLAQHISADENGTQYHLLPLQTDVVRVVKEQTHETDLIIITTSGSRRRFESSLGNIPEQIAASNHASMLVLHYPQ